MDFGEEILDEIDSGNESNRADDDYLSVLTDSESPTMDVIELEGDYQYEVLSTEEIVQHMVDCIKEVNVIVQIPPTITRILLNYFKWDKDKLYERYYGGDPEQLFKEVHVINPENSVIKSNKKSSHKSYEVCEICLREIPLNMMRGLACGHCFCTECWDLYLTTRIMDHGDVQTITCSAVGCDIIVDDQSVMNLLSDSKVKSKYQHLITNSFINCNLSLKHCPYPDCNNVIKVQYPEPRPVTCSCGHTFCFQCCKNWHEPVTCHFLKEWEKKYHDDSGTSIWIAANTKECPNCSIIIEKDGGCNHMVCKNQNCKSEFCWVCLGPWNSHRSSAWYKCNRYDDDDSKAARLLQETSRAALQRYLFYCNHYMSHMQSLKFENKLYVSIKEKMEEIQQHNVSWIEVQFLKKAVDVLCQCRETLMYTYVFAYYLKRNNQSLIFEDNQSDLEKATEVLSEYLERDITHENLSVIKQKVQDKYRYCESRRKVLLDHVHEGYDKDCWEYIE